MNPNAYISSGTLEAYALRLLSPEEAADVAAAVARYPEVAEELSRIEAGLEAMGAAGAVPPPAALEDRIWDALQTAEAPLVAAQVPTAPPVPTRVRVAPLRSKWLRAAVWTALVGSLALNGYFWKEKQQQEAVIAGTQTELTQLRQQQAAAEAAIAKFRQSSQTIFSKGAQMIPLQSLHGGQTYMLVYNEDQQVALFDMSNMPPPPAGKQYQMWAIVDGQPRSMGTIPLQQPQNGMLEMEQPAQPGQQAFAISLEKVGGNPTPTEVLMLGKLKG